jgi:hypothetical protein
MIRHFCACFSLALVTAVLPLRAADKPHAGTDSHKTVVWTNDDLTKLHDLGLICIVGQINEETQKSESLPQPYMETRDPEWYAEQAARLRDELERRKAQLSEYRQALDDARSLKETTGGIDLAGEDFATTPDAGIEILQQHVMEEQVRFDNLEDLARRNDIEPGALRGQ